MSLKFKSEEEWEKFQKKHNLKVLEGRKETKQDTQVNKEQYSVEESNHTVVALSLVGFLLLVILLSLLSLSK